MSKLFPSGYYLISNILVITISSQSHHSNHSDTVSTLEKQQAAQKTPRTVMQLWCSGCHVWFLHLKTLFHKPKIEDHTNGKATGVLHMSVHTLNETTEDHIDTVSTVLSTV